MVLRSVGSILRCLLISLYAASLSKGCSLGLTQLRYQSLALMYCAPPKHGERDPCPSMVGGRESFCQLDDPEGNHVCCGTTELLVDLLSTRRQPYANPPQKSVVPSRPPHTTTPYPVRSTPMATTASPLTQETKSPFLQDNWLPPIVSNYGMQQSPGYYVYPNPQKIESGNNLYAGSRPPPYSAASQSAMGNKTSYSDQVALLAAAAPLAHSLPVVAMAPPAVSPTTSGYFNEPQTQNYTLVLGPALTPFLASSFASAHPGYVEKPPEERINMNDESVFRRTTKHPLNVVLTNGTKIFSNLIKVIEEDGPILSLITSAQYIPGNLTNTWTATSSVVLLQDGPCSIVVNTGLPVQRNEISASLASKGITGNKLDYTVITSGLPQFIGNVNLFPASQFIVGLLYAHWTTVALSNIAVKPYIDLCSPKTQILHTPGPSPDSITVIARNVPAMGTVAVTGALFIQDDDIDRVDRPFVWDEKELIASRRKVICISDWIIPAHSVPIPVSRNLRKRAGCPTY